MNRPATHALHRAWVIVGRIVARAAIPSTLAICAVIAFPSDWSIGMARGEDLAQSALGQTALKSGHRLQRHSGGFASAGRPVLLRQGAAATGATPTPAELNERERILTKRRSESGPALRDVSSSSLRPLGAMPSATDPAQ